MSLYGGVKVVGAPDLENIRKLDMLPARAILEMQRYGFGVDLDRLADVSAKLNFKMIELRDSICSHIPPAKLDEFIARSGIADPAEGDDDETLLDWSPMNVDSNKQLAELLFQVLGVGRGKRLKTTKSGDQISTGRRQLEQLRLDHPVVGEVLQYREYAKLKNTYCDAIPNLVVIHPAGRCHCGLVHRALTYRIHTQILSTRTSTGRYACVASDTSIRTDHGTIPIKQVVVGDLVWTHRNRWRMVTATYRKGFEQMFNLHLSNGQVLTCTIGHKVLVYRNEHIEKMDSKRGKCRSSAKSLQAPGHANNKPNSQTLTGSNVPFSHVDSEQHHAGRGVYSPIKSEVLSFKNGREESNVRQDGGESPSVEGTDLRWVRVSDVIEEWQASAGTSVSDGRSIGSGIDTKEIFDSPYRRRQEKQQPEQPRVGDQGRAPYLTFYAEEGQPLCYVKEITSAGCLEVYDISVDEDESYLSCGVFSHNSKKINQQNLPIRSEFGRMIRGCFVASPGCELVSVDFSQIELRLLAFLAGVRKMIQAFIEGRDVHTMTAMEAFGISEEEVLADKIRYRNPSKNVNFAIAYRETAMGLYEQLVADSFGKAGVQVPDWLTMSWCEHFLNKWFRIYPEVKPYMDDQDYRAVRYGYTWDLFGRVRRIPQVKSTHEHVCQAGLREGGNMPIQATAAGLIKLVLPEVQEWVVNELRPADIWVWPLITVHDEGIWEVDEGAGEEFKGEVVKIFSNVLIDKDTGVNYSTVPILAEGKVMYNWTK